MTGVDRANAVDFPNEARGGDGVGVAGAPPERATEAQDTPSDGCRRTTQ